MIERCFTSELTTSGTTPGDQRGGLFRRARQVGEHRLGRNLRTLSEGARVPSDLGASNEELSLDGGYATTRNAGRQSLSGRADRPRDPRGAVGSVRLEAPLGSSLSKSVGGYPHSTVVNSRPGFAHAPHRAMYGGALSPAVAARAHLYERYRHRGRLGRHQSVLECTSVWATCRQGGACGCHKNLQDSFCAIGGSARTPALGHPRSPLGPQRQSALAGFAVFIPIRGFARFLSG